MNVLLGSRAIEEVSTVAVVDEEVSTGHGNACPFCGHASAMVVGPYGRTRGFFCFACGTRGTVEDDVSAVES